MEKNTFKSDSEFEKQVLAYLNNIGFLEQLKTTEIITDAKRQKQGIDIICKGKYEHYVDIKSVASITLPTFCFELLCCNSGNEGWLTKDEVITDYYLLTYHSIVGGTNNYAEDKQNLRSDNIDKTHIILLSRKKIKERICEELGIGIDDADETLRKIAKRIEAIANSKPDESQTFMLKDGKLLPSNTYESRGKIKFVYTGKSHKEHPINVVVPRSILDKTASKTWDINSLVDETAFYLDGLNIAVSIINRLKVMSL